MSKASETKTVAPRPPEAEFSREQVDLIRRTIAKGCTDDELRLFLGQCKRTGLDPLGRQIYAIRRWDSRERREVMQVQTSIDGLRLTAARSGEYEGAEGPLWCGADGVWQDVWLSDEPPSACKVGVWRHGCRVPFWGVARFAEFCQFDRDGHTAGLWRKMPATMLSKCAESQALRRAFPAELSGIYSSDEMAQADRDQPPPSVVNKAPEQAKPQVEQESPTRPWRSFKGMLDEFARLRGRLGGAYQHLYGQTLSEFGVEHSNQFKGGDQAAACYQRLLERVQQVEAAADGAEAMPPEDFEPPEPEATA
jgi:phage recombination protein Bet